LESVLKSVCSFEIAYYACFPQLLIYLPQNGGTKGCCQDYATCLRAKSEEHLICPTEQLSQMRGFSTVQVTNIN